MMTSEADALWAAVIEAPDDDAPRLVYADWLEEHGRPERAAFIRLQVERARAPQYDPVRDVLARRADRLFDLYGADWVAELPRLDGLAWGEFDRGFPRAVVARSLADFERVADRLPTFAPIDTLEVRGPDADIRLGRPRAHPRLRVLRIRHAGLPGRTADFFRAPLLSTLHTLELVGLGLENEAVGVLARSAPLEDLRELVLDGNPIGSGGLEALARGRLRSLTRLSLRGAGGEYGDDPIVRSEGVEALAGSGVFANLESLDLTAQEIDDDAIAYLVQSPHLVNLRELNLARNELTASGLEVLEEAGWEVRLAALDLSRNPIGDAGARRLAESEVGNELIRLTLEGCDIGPDGAEALAGADWFGGLRALNLNDNPVGPGFRALAAAGHRLGELRARRNDLGSAGARAVAGSAALGGLLILDVSNNGIGADGVRAIGASPHLTELAVLDLAYSGLPQEAGEVEPAMAALAARAPTLLCLILDGNRLAAPGVLGLAGIGWPRLGELGLRGCWVNRPALAWLARDGSFPALNRLGLGGNGVDPEGLKDLLRAPFVAGLTHLDLANNRLGNDGAKRLAETDLPRLRWLSLEGNDVRGVGFRALARSKALPRLLTVRHLGNPGRDWWEQVRQRFPGDEMWPTPVAYLDEDIPF
jgi:uncharacterized protein (TIGR02996 family)